MSTTKINSDYLASIAYSLQDIVDELSTVSYEVDNEYPPRGTIVKAMPDQFRFKPQSMWVSLGDGNYKHITGKKGLIAKHSRLITFTDEIFRP